MTDQIIPATSSDAELKPHVTIIVGSAGLRHLLSTYVRCRWPQASIEEIDPFSQTMPGGATSPLLGTRSDAIVLGGIGTEDEALNSLKRLRSRKHCPPILLIVSPLLLKSTGQFLAAGANHVLNRESLSASRLVGSLAAELHGGEARAAIATPTAGVSDASGGSIELVVNGQRHQLHFDGYRALKSIAATPLALVLGAEEIGTREPVIIKIPTASPLHDPEALATFCERYAFLSRAESRHIVKYRDAGVVGSWPYAVMEHLPGGDLRARITKGIQPIEALRLLLQLTLALEALHVGNLAHMDIKPENIFFRSSDELVLIDYNIATRFGRTARNRTNGDVLGTPFYMSPEQGQGLAIDGRSDLYSAGVILFEMLTGQQPYQGENAAQVLYRHIHDEIPLLPKRLRKLQPLQDRLLEKNPADRYASATEMIAAIEPLLLLADFAEQD